MTNIVEIKAHPNQDAIDVLEEALVRARSGDIVSVGISWVTKEKSICGDVSAGPNQILMFAALEHNARSFYMDNFYED